MVVNSTLILRRLRKNIRLERSAIEEIQRDKLMALIQHAYENVPYYRRLFDLAGVKPQDIKGVEDIKYLPITDKTTFRALDKKEITAKNIGIRNCVEVFTSGSTGMPTHIYFTEEDYALLDLIYLRSFLENGLKFRYKRAFILDPHSFETKRCWYHRLGLATYTNISCFLNPEEQVRILEKEIPDFIHGYPSSLTLISKLIIGKGHNDLRPAMVSTAAELLNKKDRELITSAFGVNLYDRYAARECGNIAWECDGHNGYHINIDTLVLEFVKDGKPAKPGERGDIVVTNLHSYAMPFIRYRIGDVGIPSKEMCPCGIELPLMEIIEGRDEDFIILKGGKAVSPMMVTGALDYILGIKQFRVVQENMGTIIAFIAKGDGFMHDTVARAERGLKDILGEDVNILCQVVEDIPREPSGKVRAVISKVAS